MLRSDPGFTCVLLDYTLGSVFAEDSVVIYKLIN